MTDWSKIKRKKQAMPMYVRQSLLDQNLLHKFAARPAYQQNDYLSWIKRAMKQETKESRLSQMISELKKGNVYMKMRWSGK